MTQIVEQAGEPAKSVAAQTSLSKPTSFRWLVLLLFSMVYLICYMDRGNLSVAHRKLRSNLG